MTEPLPTTIRGWQAYIASLLGGTPGASDPVVDELQYISRKLFGVDSQGVSASGSIQELLNRALYIDLDNPLTNNIGMPLTTLLYYHLGGVTQEQFYNKIDDMRTNTGTTAQHLYDNASGLSAAQLLGDMQPDLALTALYLQQGLGISENDSFLLTMLQNDVQSEINATAYRASLDATLADIQTALDCICDSTTASVPIYDPDPTAGYCAGYPNIEGRWNWAGLTITTAQPNATSYTDFGIDSTILCGSSTGVGGPYIRKLVTDSQVVCFRAFLNPNSQAVMLITLVPLQVNQAYALSSRGIQTLGTGSSTTKTMYRYDASNNTETIFYAVRAQNTTPNIPVDGKDLWLYMYIEDLPS